MKVWTRHFLFFAKITLETLGLALGMVLALILISGLQADMSGWKDIWMQFPYYLLLSVLLMSMIVDVGSFVSYIPLVISFGGRRRDIFVWKQIQKATLILLTTGLRAIFMLFSGQKMTLSFFLLLAALQLSVAAIGEIIGIINAVWGKWGKIIFTICCFVVGAVLGGSVAMMVDSSAEFFSKIATYIKEIQTILITVMMAVYAVGTILMGVMMKKLEVKF